MASGKELTPQELQAAVDAVHIYGNCTKAARETGIPYNQLWARVNKARQEGYTASSEATPSHIPFSVDEGNTSTLIGPDGVKLQWIKSDKTKALKEALHKIVEAAKDDLPRVPPVKFKLEKYHKDLMAVVPWGDPHFGLLCWEPEVGNDFDITIAEQQFIGAVKYLIGQSIASERMVLINLGDFFHADNNRAETYNGTRLDVDSRLHRVIQTGVRAVRTCIDEALKKHKVVEIVTVQGNHDETLAMCLAILLDNVYENEPRVIVHAQPTRRKYVQHGKVLIGAVHGDKQNLNKLPLIMATEKSKEWGESTHRVFFRGHHHHDHIQEFNGCTVEQVRTLAPTDEYAVSAGWLSKSDMKLITYHKEFGEVHRSKCSIEMLRSLGE